MFVESFYYGCQRSPAMPSVGLREIFSYQFTFSFASEPLPYHLQVAPTLGIGGVELNLLSEAGVR